MQNGGKSAILLAKCQSYTQGIVCGQVKTALSFNRHSIADGFSGTLYYRLCNGRRLVEVVF